MDKSKKIALTSGTVLAVVGAGSSALAADGSSAVVTALTATASDITSTMSSIGPIGLGIAGTFLVWRYGMKFFKSISK